MSLIHLRRSIDKVVNRNKGALLTEPILPAAKPGVVASISAGLTVPVLVVTARTDQAEQLVARIGAYLPADRQPKLWDTPQSIPYEQLPFEHQAAAERVRILTALLDGETPIIVAAARNLMHLTLAPDDLRAMRRTLKAGERINADEVMLWATEMGYQRVPLVYEPGTIAQRGGVIDLFPPDAEFPIRLDLFGDEIESIRQFDAHSQRSRVVMAEVHLLPPVDIPIHRTATAVAALRAIDDRSLRNEVRAEWRALLDRIEAHQLPAGIDLVSPAYRDGTSTLLDSLPAGTQVIFDDQQAVFAVANEIAAHAEELKQGFVTNGELPAGMPVPYLSPELLKRGLAIICQSRFAECSGRRGRAGAGVPGCAAVCRSTAATGAGRAVAAGRRLVGPDCD